MSRSLPRAFVSESANPATTPGYLLEIEFSAVLRLSSRGDTTFNGNQFIRWGFTVRGLVQDAMRASNDGSVVIDNTDNTVGTYVLTEGIADRRIRLWAYYGNPPDALNPLALPYSDAVPLFSGFGDECAIDPTTNLIEISLIPENTFTMFGPRTYVTPANGFNWAPPGGTKINWGGQVFVLESDRG